MKIKNSGSFIALFSFGVIIGVVFKGKSILSKTSIVDSRVIQNDSGKGVSVQCDELPPTQVALPPSELTVWKKPIKKWLALLIIFVAYISVITLWSWAFQADGKMLNFVGALLITVAAAIELWRADNRKFSLLQLIAPVLGAIGAAFVMVAAWQATGVKLIG